MEPGYRPDWCPIIDSDYSAEKWSTKKHETLKN
jgi:hypothetical protein